MFVCIFIQFQGFLELKADKNDPFYLSYLQLLHITDLNVNTSTSYSIGIQSITQPLLIYIHIYTYIYTYILHDQGLIVAALHFEAPGVAAKNLGLKRIPQLRGAGGKKIGHTNADARQSEYMSESISVTHAREGVAMRGNRMIHCSSIVHTYTQTYA